MLYDRDYRVLTEDEKLIWGKVESIFNKEKMNNIVTPTALNKYYKNIPAAALHYKQIFPNNFLSPDELKDKQKLQKLIEEFRLIIDKPTTERDILSFIRNKKAYFIIASILKSQHYRFGHHAAFAFKEFMLPPNYLVDYLLTGKNSGGY